MTLADLLLRSVITLIFGITTILFVLVGRRGLRIKELGFGTAADLEGLELVRQKKFLLTLIFGLMAVGVILIELVAWGSNDHTPDLFHLGCVAVFIVSLALARTNMNGSDNPKGHGWITYICLGSYTVALITGMRRLWLG